MATESKANKNVTATCIVQVVRLISLKLLKLATHETLNTDWERSVGNNFIRLVGGSLTDWFWLVGWLFTCWLVCQRVA